MVTISFENVAFHYAAPYTPIFDGLSLAINTQWRTGLVGRNGRGKTTLLNLIHRQLEPVEGHLTLPLQTTVFPYTPPDPDYTTLEIVRTAVAPFTHWETDMQRLLELGDDASLARYGEILERYQALGGYEIDERIAAEAAQTGLAAEILQRPFSTLSGGERTRALIIALFLQPDVFPLIDEPTNHLDMSGREALGRYLATKSGFILVSHDRYFLDLCVDHIVALNKNDVRVHQCNFSAWKRQMEVEEEVEMRTNEKIKREVKALKRTAQKRRLWSDNKEKEKIGAADKGAIGAKAAKLMQHALSTERRIREKLNAKQDLLKNQEKERHLKLNHERQGPEYLLKLDNVSAAIAGRWLFRDLSLRLRQGDRLAVVGPNGCGKTTLFRLIAGEIEAATGSIDRPNHLKVFQAYQIPLWGSGSLRQHLADASIDETHFRQVMGVFGVEGEVFDRPLETFSEGQRKKVDLCRSFLEPAHLLLWDEPLNYLDLMSREQIEAVLQEYQPTLLFIEHDRLFVERVATDVIRL